MSTANSAANGAFGKAGIAIGTTPADLSTAAAIDYGIAGLAYTKAITATSPMTAAAQQAAQTTCVYLVQLDAAGTLSTVKGEEVSNDLVGSATAPGQNSVQVPYAGQDNCPIGMIIITTLVAATFTAGTTSLAAADVKDTFVDFIGGMPANPQIIQSV